MTLAARTYLCIDLKSFYASVECVERGLDPMTARLVVADPSRTEKTICLAVSPSMKALGVKNRCRVFQIPPGIDYIMATPRMQLYIDYAAEIYAVYLRFVAKEDIHVYSIDEAFLDVTDYLATYQMTPRELAERLMTEVLVSTGIPATCGIGTNLYLAKIALDITAKHTEDRIGELDEDSYKASLWGHKPITDFWRIGEGTARRLASRGITTMGEVAASDEDSLYQLLGIDAELLIDHAWGREPCTIADIKAYKPKTNCLTSGQVLSRGYSKREGRTIVREMVEALTLDMVDKGLVTKSITMYMGFARTASKSQINGTEPAGNPTSSTKKLLAMALTLFDRLMDERDELHRVNITFNNVTEEIGEQYDLFTDPVELEKERGLQAAMLSIQKKYGKNAILKAADLQEEATTMERNAQIGGHKA